MCGARGVSELVKSYSSYSLAAAAAAALAVASCGSEPSTRRVVDSYGRSLTARCTSAPSAAGSPSTSCSGVELGPTPAGIYVPGDIIDGQTGWGADELAAAYNVPTTLPAKQKIGILTGGYNPALEADMAVYRTQYGLPACTTANGCLQIVDARGGSTFPAPRYEDIPESSMQVQVASAVCPHCQMIIVVASDDPSRTPTLAEIAAAENEAVTLGATATTTSYGAPEVDENGQPWSAPFEQVFVQNQQFPLFAAAGDLGYLSGSSPDHAVRVPAAFPEVVAVGGTALSQVPADVSMRRWAETPLPTTSSGCSTIFTKPSWQKDTGCAKRTVADMATAADGALVYFTTVDPAGSDAPGWHTEGGTGESAALAVAIFATSNQAYNGGPSFSYQNPSYFNDLVGGSNGSCGTNAYLCSGQVGYDGPTGNGSPNGGVFQGTWLSLTTTSYAVAQNAGDGGELHTVGDWALSCNALTLYATGLPQGVSATFGDEEINDGDPYFQFSLSATVDAPLVQDVRVTLVADCDGTLHTLSIFVDVTPCVVKTSCLATDGIPNLCGGAASNGCGGTIQCGDCGTFYTCVNNVCISTIIDMPP
jgi:hypothetical protein